MNERVVARDVVVTGSETAEALAATLADDGGFETEVVATDGILDYLETASPAALVVVDDLQSGTAIETFEAVRDTGATLPVLLVGDGVDSGRIEAALSAGVTDYVADTGRTAELSARIRAHVATPTLDGYVETQRQERTIGSLAHDVKNPLNVIAGRLELLDVEDTHADAIDRSIARVESLIDEVTLLASAGRPGEPQQVDITETAERVWSEFDTDAATLVAETELTAETDADALTLLFRRLFENAVAHGGDGVTVTVGGTEAGFYVADDGSGLPDDVGEELFEQGYGTARDGEGYGLFVADRAAAANGWALSAGASEAGGARFDVQYR